MMGIVPASVPGCFGDEGSVVSGSSRGGDIVYFLGRCGREDSGSMEFELCFTLCRVFKQS